MKIVYRFLPCDEAGCPREDSNVSIQTDDVLRVGSVVDASALGYEHWEVVEIRDDSGPLIAATDQDGMSIPLGGTVVCRGIG